MKHSIKLYITNYNKILSAHCFESIKNRPRKCNENTKSGIFRGLFICRISELNPRTKTLHTAQTKPVLKESKQSQNPFSLVSLIRKLSFFAVILSFCAEPKAKSQNPSSKITLVLRGEGGPSKTVGEGQTRTLTNTLFLL